MPQARGGDRAGRQFPKRISQSIEIPARRVHVRRRARGLDRAEALQEGQGGHVPGAYRNASRIERACNRRGWMPFDHKREHGHALSGTARTDDPKPRDVGEPGQPMLHEIFVVAAQRVVTSLLEEPHGSGEADRARDIRRAGLELQRAGLEL
jgi:hypothetical protein